MLKVVHGNIASGKTTLISKETDYIIVQEDIQSWGDYFNKFYESINKYQHEQAQNYVHKQDIINIINFELVVFLTIMKKYKQLDPTKNYIFERSLCESLVVFVDTLKTYFKDDQCIYDHMYGFLEQMVLIEPKFNEHIYLNQPVDVLVERIANRNRQGETVSREYLEQLQVRYQEFEKMGFILPRFEDNEDDIEYNSEYVNVSINSTSFGRATKYTMILSLYHLCMLQQYGCDESLVNQFRNILEVEEDIYDRMFINDTTVNEPISDEPISNEMMERLKEFDCLCGHVRGDKQQQLCEEEEIEEDEGIE